MWRLASLVKDSQQGCSQVWEGMDPRPMFQRFRTGPGSLLLAHILRLQELEDDVDHIALSQFMLWPTISRHRALQASDG